jgi:hypothetical protein
MPFMPSPEPKSSAAAKGVTVIGEHSPSLPSATGPTDEDLLEKEFMEEARQAIKDGREHSTPDEMAAYDHVLEWVEHQPIDRLIARAKKNVRYDSFLFDTENLRFKLVDLTLNVRRIVVEPYTSATGTKFYELHGFTQESGQLLYFGMVTGLPEGMPIGDINEQVRLVGYFYKKQGYISQASLAKGSHIKMVAPLIVGRIIWQQSAEAPSLTANLPPWLVGLIAAVICVAVAGWVFFASRPNKPLVLPPLRISNRADPDAPSVDDWLDQAQTGRLPGDLSAQSGGSSDRSSLAHEADFVEKNGNGHAGAILGNIFDPKNESNSGSSDGHGHSDSAAN